MRGLAGAVVVTDLMPVEAHFGALDTDPVGTMATVQLLSETLIREPDLDIDLATRELDRRKDLIAIVTALVDVYDNRGAVIWLQIGQFGQGHHDTAMDLIRWGRAAEVIARIEHLQSSPPA
jgi:hypothetical protein